MSLFYEEDLPTIEEAEELSKGITISEVDMIIAEDGVWSFLKQLNKNSFMQIYYAMTDKDNVVLGD
jgi:hypothetical protein